MIALFMAFDIPMVYNDLNNIPVIWDSDYRLELGL